MGDWEWVSSLPESVPGHHFRLTAPVIVLLLLGMKMSLGAIDGLCNMHSMPSRRFVP
jgi:hypothetical protein